MSKIPEAVVDAAFAHRDYSQDLSAGRARRVILALADDLPDSAVDAAVKAFLLYNVDKDERVTISMRRAIIDALKDVVEGE